MPTMRLPCRVAALPAFGRRRFWRDRKGSFATEFALILPIALLMLFSLFTFGEAYSISRKVAIASHTLADLVARRIGVTTADVTTILNASAQIAAPYPIGNMSIVLAELYTDSSNVTKVVWNRTLNATGLTNGATFTLPAGLGQANTYLIYAYVLYTYTPPLHTLVPASIPISNVFYINPRVSASVPLT
jgi:Flp pilus assembly protein TadG